jgi:hypothetical protein
MKQLLKQDKTTLVTVLFAGVFLTVHVILVISKTVYILNVIK